MIRFGILGCGTIARRFAAALNKSDRAELAACAARQTDRAEAFAAQFGGRAYGSYEALLADPEIQAVYIATVHTAHAELAKKAILAGKAVLSEKPFFVNSREAEDVVQLAREKNILIMEGFWTRTQPAYQQAMQWIKEGRIGKLRLIKAAFCFSMPYREELKGHRLWNPETAGGAFWDAGIYPYEFATGIMGKPPVEVQTMVAKAPTGVDMTVSMNLRFEGDVIADLLTSIGGTTDGTGTITGSEGYITLDYFVGSRHAELHQGRETVEVFDDPEEEGFVHEIAHFVSLLEEGRNESDINPLALTLDLTQRGEGILNSR